MSDEEKVTRYIERLHAVKGWYAVYHDSNDREQAFLAPVVYFAHVTSKLGEDVTSEVVAMVYDVESTLPELSFVDDVRDFISLCPPGREVDGDWNYIAAERVKQEEEEEERAERKRQAKANPLGEHEHGTNNPRGASFED